MGFRGKMLVASMLLAAFLSAPLGLMLCTLSCKEWAEEPDGGAEKEPLADSSRVAQSSPPANKVTDC